MTNLELSKAPRNPEDWSATERDFKYCTDCDGYRHISHLEKEAKFCFECQTWNHLDKMQPSSCVICGGFKCHNHGGSKVHECHECGIKGLCVDCMAHGKCCREFDGTVFYMNKNMTYKKLV